METRTKREYIQMFHETIGSVITLIFTGENAVRCGFTGI